jgi:hypothetical protein
VFNTICHPYLEKQLAVGFWQLANSDGLIHEADIILSARFSQLPIASSRVSLSHRHIGQP